MEIKPGKEGQRRGDGLKELHGRAPVSEPKATPEPPHNHWVILWDGECGFCGRAVAALLRHAQRRAGRPALAAIPHQQTREWLPPEILAAASHQFHLRAPEGQYWGGGAALTRLVAVLGYSRLAWALERWPVRPLVHATYRWVSRHRAWLGKHIFRP